MDNTRANSAKKVVVLLLLAIVMTISLGVSSYQGAEITLTVEGETVQMVSYSATVEELLMDEEIEFGKDTLVEPGLDTLLTPGLKITVTDPKTYTVVFKDDVYELKSYNTRVEDILEDADINIGPKDFSTPALDSEVRTNTTIEFFQVEEKLRVENTSIPFETEVINNIRLDKGITNTLQEGKDGSKRSHIKDIYINGEMSSSVVVLDTVVSEPVSQVIERGVNDVVSTSRGDVRFKEALILNASAYDLSFASTGKRPGDPGYGITASGTTARPGTVAVDPRVIPLGTKLYVESLDGSRDYGFAIAEDTGGAIKGYKIDLFYNSNAAAMSFGRRDVKVYILD
ncbi:3D domain-containing protein [Gudongella sp. SC589]|uniref:3D domain-containing protein n=1 Tax=Gudongella sp. SC589 TaxID=3385990 RepID=UPI003904BC37